MSFKKSYLKNSWLEKAFPTPLFLTLNPFGLDISSKAVRIMRFKKTKVGLIPEIYDEVLFKSPCKLLEKEEDLKTCMELQEALIALKKKNNIQFANVSIPEMKTYIFKSEIPKEALPNISEIIKFKIEENVPLDPRDVVFDYQIPGHNVTHNNHIDVVVTVLPKGVIETYTSLFDMVGITPISFESESRSAARAMISSEDDGSHIIIHFGKTKINIALVEDGVVHYTSSISINPSEVIKDFNNKEAQLMKQQINKLLIYWFTNKHDPNNQERIESAILTGVVATAPGLVDFLEKGLKISVKVGNVWQNCFSLDDYIPPISHEKSLDYAVSVGLALINN